MELGEKIKQTRIAAGLSQRQLCGETITRNMLSQIEHGTASPSVATLRFLAAGLGKPVSYFLDEDAVVSVNQQVMEQAWSHYDREEFDAAFRLLEAYRRPDPVYDRELEILQGLTVLALAEKALRENRRPYARQLLSGLPERMPISELERTKGLLRLELGETANLPSMDRELRLRAEAALAAGDPDRAANLLDAAQDRQDPSWMLLRGRVSMAGKAYREAVKYLSRVESAYPRETAQLLESCYRELGDFQNAYGYACKFRSFGD